MTGFEDIARLMAARGMCARLFGGLAFFLALAPALFVRLGLNDGNWLLFVPSAACLGVMLRPTRLSTWFAIAATLILIGLGMASVGLFYVPTVIALALAFRARPTKRTR
jgi:hypothetical protein